MSAPAGHPYHMVNPSPWPALGALAAFCTTIGAVFYFHDEPLFGINGIWKLVPGFVLIVTTMALWWKDVIHESVIEHVHTHEVSHGLRVGMGLFIASEVMFFFAFFWAFFHHSLGFSTATLQWPPVGIEPLETWHLPFYNTVILLTSGVTITRAHVYVERGDNRNAALWLWVTAALGALFLGTQAYEYVHASFSITEGIYPTTFYLATGFHGFHVFVGTSFLVVCAFRAMKAHNKPEKHIGFQACAWYWHFVDVVWLFLFVWIYWLLGLPVREFAA